MPKTEKFVKPCKWLQNATAWTKIKVWWRPVVLQKNAKKWENFETLQFGCRVAQHKQKSKFDQNQSSSSWEKCQNWEICETLQLAAECHSMNKNQCLMKTSSSLEKCKKVKEIWKHCKWLQSATAWTKIKVWSKSDQ